MAIPQQRARLDISQQPITQMRLCDRPELDKPLGLICDCCGRTDSYRVGTVHISPTRFFPNENLESREYHQHRVEMLQLSCEALEARELRSRNRARPARTAKASDPNHRDQPTLFPMSAPIDLVNADPGKDGTDAPAESNFDDAVIPPNGVHRRLEKSFGFMRYVRCKHCDAGGPWRLPVESVHTILVELVREEYGFVAEGAVFFAEMCLNDRTWSPLPTQSESIYRERIAADPTNWQLYLRLGNLLKNSGRPDLAIEPFKECLRLNPLELDVHAMLAQIHEDRNAPRQAVAQWKELLRNARFATDMPREDRLDRVSIALDSIGKLTGDLQEAFDLMPKPEPPPVAGVETNAPLVAHLISLDLSKDGDWNRVCRVFLGEPMHTPAELKLREVAAGLRGKSGEFADGSSAGNRAGRGLRFHPNPEWAGASNPVMGRGMRARGRLIQECAEVERDDHRLEIVKHVGRNDPCPCGSGKKYKRCCGGAHGA